MLGKLLGWIFFRRCPTCREPMLRQLKECDACYLARAYGR